MDEMAYPKEELRSEFCPPIDEALFYAICSDYDLEDRAGLADCLCNLRKLKEDTVESDTTLFDASGTGAFSAAHLNSDLDLQGSWKSSSSETGNTSDLYEGNHDQSPNSGRASDDPFAESQCLNEASEEARGTELREMFPDISQDNIMARLRKCDGNFTRALDELLNFAFIPKSVDGFDSLHARGAGQRGARKRRKAPESLSETNWIDQVESSIPTSPRMAWSSMLEDASPSSLQIVKRYPPIDLSAQFQSTTANPRSPLSWNKVNYTSTNRNLPKARSDLYGAERLVKTHSQDVLDLHGYTVVDAVSLAREYVTSWWHSLGDRKYATGGGGPVRAGCCIVTGAGHHSKNGTPKIRPAVIRALVGDGWRIIDGQGQVMVTGKARRS